MKIYMIAAVADNMAIGKDNGMPWHISEDFKYFKRTTMGCPIIMGRKTYLSIGRPLPGRKVIVISSRDRGNVPEGVVLARSLEEAYSEAEAAGSDKCFIIGGGSIYRQALPDAEKLYITHVHTTIEDAGVFFPEIDPEIWEEESSSEMKEDAASGLKFQFKIYGRRRFDFVSSFHE